MITLRPGSHAYRLLLLLSAAGEFPTRSMRLLGSVRSLEALVYRLEHTQQFRNESGADLGRCRMLSVSGKRDRRTIRLHKTALPLLNALHPAALEQYLALSGGHRFSSSDGHVQRNHRVAETLAVCMGAGVEFRPYELPALQKQRIVQIVPTFPAFYTARSLKRLDSTEMNKTIFTRLTGALFARETCWAVYNTRGAVMKWSGMGEFKTAQHLAELARMNAGLPRADHALLLGECMDIALRTMEESDKSRRMELRFDRIYPHIHFIPLDRQGIRLLRILTLPNWNEQVLSAVFPSEWRVVGPGIIERDAQRDGTFILSHLDGDLARLLRLRQALEHSEARCEVLCFPWQTAFVRDYLGSRVGLREVTVDALEDALGLTDPEYSDPQEEVPP